jgi:glycosyltransferase involved in cell wall biosynthesis
MHWHRRSMILYSYFTLSFIFPVRSEGSSITIPNTAVPLSRTHMEVIGIPPTALELNQVRAFYFKIYLTCDRLLLVSQFYYDRLRTQLSMLGPLIQQRFEEVARVVGLPIDTDLIDQLKTSRDYAKPPSTVRVLFNHALRRPKRPDVALAVMDKVLSKTPDCVFHITRSFHPDELAIESTLREVATRHPGRIVHHDTLTLTEYYKLLWSSDVQFSTAEHESFGVSTVEAMYTHNACFTPRQESYPEITGGIGNYDDPEHLVRCLLTAIQDPVYRVTVADAQQMIARKFSGVQLAAKIAQLITTTPPCGSRQPMMAGTRECRS